MEGNANPVPFVGGELGGSGGKVAAECFPFVRCVIKETKGAVILRACGEAAAWQGTVGCVPALCFG